MATEVHTLCVTALNALDASAAAALNSGALDELRPLAARLMEARRLLEALPLDDKPPAHLQNGGGGLRRAVELCIWEVRQRLRLLGAYATGNSAAMDERKRIALQRLLRSLLARLNGEPDPEAPHAPPSAPISSPATNPPSTSPPPSPPPMPRPSSPPLASASEVSAGHQPLSPLPSSPPAAASPTATPAIGASSSRAKLPKLNLSVHSAPIPQSADELPQETPRSAFFLRTHTPLPPAIATPRTRDETRRKAVAEGDASAALSSVASPSTSVSSLSPSPTPSVSSALSTHSTPPLDAAVIMERDSSGAWLVQGGSVLRLIERATAPDCPDATFPLLFLLTFRTFLSPEVLLSRLLERHTMSPLTSSTATASADRWKDEVLRPVQARVAALIRQWLDLEGSDWCPALRPVLASNARPLFVASGHDALVQRIDTLLASPLPTSAAPLPPPSPRGIGPSENFLTLAPLDVVKYLCRSDSALLAAVRHTELLSHGWTRAEWADRCPALSKVIARFNALSHWLCSLILTLDMPRLRAKMYGRWVKIAVQLRRFGNFASLMAVVAALHNPAISRLKHTIREVPRKRIIQLDELELLMRPISNFRAYREALLLSAPPCVPYMGVFLTDLTFIEDGNPDFISPSIVNFRKRRLLAEVLLLVQRLQAQAYSFPRSATVDSFVENQLGISHDVKRLFELSLQREPRAP